MIGDWKAILCHHLHWHANTHGTPLRQAVSNRPCQREQAQDGAVVT